MQLKAEIETRLSTFLSSSNLKFNDIPLLRGDLVDQLKQYVRDEKSGKRKLDETPFVSTKVIDCSGSQFSQIEPTRSTSSESETLEQTKRDRNEEHAKLARDRKKLFIEKLKESIFYLESNNTRMRLHLQVVKAEQTNYTSNNAFMNVWTAKDNNNEVDYI